MKKLTGKQSKSLRISRDFSKNQWKSNGAISGIPLGMIANFLLIHWFSIRIHDSFVKVSMSGFHTDSQRILNEYEWILIDFQRLSILIPIKYLYSFLMDFFYWFQQIFNIFTDSQRIFIEFSGFSLILNGFSTGFQRIFTESKWNSTNFLTSFIDF